MSKILDQRRAFDMLYQNDKNNFINVIEFGTLNPVKTDFKVLLIATPPPYLIFLKKLKIKQGSFLPDIT